MVECCAVRWAEEVSTGTFFVEVLLAAATRPERREAVELLVDSGSPYTWVGPPVSARLRSRQPNDDVS